MKGQRQTLVFLCVLFILSLTPVAALFGQAGGDHVESLTEATAGQPKVHFPLKQLRLTSSFGYRKHPLTGTGHFHEGVDLAANRDTVYSILPGKVVQVAEDGALGRYVRIKHGVIESIYGHLSVIAVQPGQRVTIGQPIAITGATGRVTGEHLHFAVRSGNKPVPPLRFLASLQIRIQTNHE